MKHIFYYLATLNFVDAVCTYIGIELQIISEKNPIMNQILLVDSLLFISVKFLLSLLLYGFVLFNKVPAAKWIRNLALFASIPYTFICMLHVYWIVTFV
ncbi:DUF5658 family protein [Fredinandcohnia humi]